MVAREEEVCVRGSKWVKGISCMVTNGRYIFGGKQKKKKEKHNPKSKVDLINNGFN